MKQLASALEQGRTRDADEHLDHLEGLSTNAMRRSYQEGQTLPKRAARHCGVSRTDEFQPLLMPQPTSGFSTRRPGKRLKSRSAVRSAVSP